MDKFNLLITDVCLPSTNRRKLAKMMRKRRPGLKVLFITGYAGNATMTDKFLAEGMDMFAKPFTINAFAHKERRLLEH